MTLNNELECWFCKKTDKDVTIWCGGFIGKAHEECMDLATRTIEQYLRFCWVHPLGMNSHLRRLLESHPRLDYVITTKQEEMK